MSSKWLAAFKEIHGKTPTKADYELAPRHIREELLGRNEEEEESVKETNIRRKTIRLKRPADDQISPYKPRPKRQLLDLATTPTLKEKTSRMSFARKLDLQTSTSKSTQALRTSPRKHLTRVNSNIFDTPEKESRPISEGSVKFSNVSEENLTTSKNISIENMSCFSPKRSTKLAFSPFTTPEKCKNFSDGKIEEILKTPIRSPQKPCRKAVHITNVSALLAPSPVKKVVVKEEEEEEKFEAEHCEEKKKRLPAGRVAKVFDPTTGRIIARAFKRCEEPELVKSKEKIIKEKGNFIRINMKKKSFTRGKVSAEAKRKLRKKQLWKKRFGGNK